MRRTLILVTALAAVVLMTLPAAAQYRGGYGPGYGPEYGPDYGRRYEDRGGDGGGMNPMKMMPNPMKMFGGNKD